MSHKKRINDKVMEKLKLLVCSVIFSMTVIGGGLFFNCGVVYANYEHSWDCQLSQYSINKNLTESNGLSNRLSGYGNSTDKTLYLNFASGSKINFYRIILKIDGTTAYDRTYSDVAVSRCVSYSFYSKQYGVGDHTAKWTLYDTDGSTYSISTTWNVWKSEYVISYDANGGSGAPANQTKYYEETLYLSSTKPTKTGYTFLGWSISSTSTSASYSSGSAFTINSNTTLYAIWRQNPSSYKIQFNANGGSGVPSSITQSGTGTSVVMGDIGSAMPTREGYTFYGWSASSSWSTKRVAYSSGKGGGTAPDGTVATTTNSNWTYANYCSYTGGSTSSTTLTLYAQWKENTYTIQFDANGGSGVPSSITKTGTSTSVTMGDIGSRVPEKSGYIFYGWSASSSWSTKRIAYGSSSGGVGAYDGTTARVTSSSWTYADYCSYTGGSTSSTTLTLYAQWLPPGVVSMSACTISLSSTSFTYDGNRKEPSITVKDGATTLIKGSHYTVSFSDSDRTDVGIVFVTITGMGKYMGSVTKIYDISTRPITSASVNLSSTSYTYSGGERRPTITVTYGGVTLVANTDYTYTYRDNVNVGTAEAEIKGIGNYSGTYTKTYMITPKSITNSMVTLEKTVVSFDGVPKKPKVIVKNGSSVLVENKDYTIQYTNNINVGTGNVAVTGKGNYKATINKTFEIDAANIVSLPKGTLAKVKSRKKKKIDIEWKKITWPRAGNGNGYHVQISMKSNFANASNKYYGASNKGVRLAGAKSKKKYYVRMRPYLKVNGYTNYGAWSSVKKVKVK